MTKKYFLITMLAIVSFLLVVFFVFYQKSDLDLVSSINKYNKDKSEQQINDLFVYNAGQASFEVLDKENNEYTLTLNQLDDDVIYFTDRPVREAGRVKLAKFLSGLGFEIGNPPNAAIVLNNTQDDEQVTVVGELTEPILIEDQDELLFRVKLLRDDDGQLTEYGNNDVTTTFSEVTLLIDGCAKKGEKFCGSTGQCYNPKKQHCGGVKDDSWKKHKDEKCHGLKLEDAYKYAKGPDSECLIYHKASLDKYGFVCDDDLKAWKIPLHVEFKGEESDCRAHCLVYAKESHKKGGRSGKNRI